MITLDRLFLMEDGDDDWQSPMTYFV